ncbi:LysM peptidoglycan-binding domain-containing protein [Planococcus lenghuensis]|uniref:LysM domain-containing protein n=1 Tax=Planococcus lenghuensis TaxID=2213202 RepID=A0A1Q2KZM2_9BACL|nr:LysM peptidoglycan-binding domain-containing protein [Planococcus lenghuensis]AQQ53645.1 hypothetical protein B0X71_11540 [Planococcus lenghuensis]
MGNRKYRKPIDRYQPPTPMDTKKSPSRTARRQAGKGSAANHEQRNAGASRGGRLLSVLFFVFIFLPVFAVFLYVAVIYSPDEEKQISVSSSNEVSFQENAKPITPLVIPDEEPAEEAPEEPAAEPAAEITEEEPEAVQEVEPAEEPAPEKPAEPEPEEPDAPQQIHTVQKGETLYRIAISYYGTSTAVDRIMQANGMNTPDLSIGETLVLPN